VLSGGLLLGAVGAALAPAGPGALVPFKIAIASAASAGDDVYVAVVVDFGGGSSPSSISKCVPVAPTAKDSDALAAALGTSNVSYSNSGLLCAIDNYPVNGVQNCGQSVGPGKYNYWSYWHGTSGSWVYASDGPTEQPVASPANDVEGWRFQSNEPDNSNSPPPTPSAAYAQICNAATEVPPSSGPTTTTSSPPVIAATTTTTGATATSPAHVAPTTTPSPSTGGGGVATSTTTTTTMTTTTTTDRAGSSAKVSAGGSRHAEASSATHQGSGGSGSPLLPVLAAVAVVAALGGAAIFRWRRRPADE
jgi:hypothetical protein